MIICTSHLRSCVQSREPTQLLGFEDMHTINNISIADSTKLEFNKAQMCSICQKRACNRNSRCSLQKLFKLTYTHKLGPSCISLYYLLSSTSLTIESLGQDSFSQDWQIRLQDNEWCNAQFTCEIVHMILHLYHLLRHKLLDSSKSWIANPSMKEITHPTPIKPISLNVKFTNSKLLVAAYWRFFDVDFKSGTYYYNSFVA